MRVGQLAGRGQSLTWQALLATSRLQKQMWECFLDKMSYAYWLETSWPIAISWLGVTEIERVMQIHHRDKHFDMVIYVNLGIMKNEYWIFSILCNSFIEYDFGKPQSSLVILSGWCWNNGRKMLLVLRKCWKVAFLFKISRSRASQSKRWTVHKKKNNQILWITKLVLMIRMGEEK